MNRIQVAAFVGLGMMFGAAPALAGVASVTSSQLVKPGSQVEQIRYRSNILPEAIIGGVISGVLGGVIGGNCYFNDCGYDNGPSYGGGGYYGGGGRVGGFRGGGGRGGGGVRMSHAAIGAGHAGGGGRGGGRK